MTGFQVETMKSGNSIPCECMANQRSELPYELPLASLLQIVSENVRNLKMDVLLDGRAQLALNSLLQLAFPALSMKEASPCSSYFLT